MDQAKQRLCVFELRNRQESYARALRTITCLEKHSTGSKQPEPMDDGLFLPFDIISISKWEETGKELFVALANRLPHDYASSRRATIQSIQSEEQLLEGLSKEKSEVRFYYCFKVLLNLEETDLTDLQYLVLLIQSFADFNQRCVVCFSNEEPERSWSSQDFFRISHYLRFIYPRYPIFYADSPWSPGRVIPLKDDSEWTQKTFLPLLEVDRELLWIFSAACELEVNYRKEGFTELYQTLSPKGGNVVGTLPISLFQTGARMLFESMDGRKYGTQSKKEELLSFLYELVRRQGGITPLDMVLFGALGGLELEGGLNMDRADACLSNIRVFSNAICQILENILFHSQNGKGVFTFRLQQNKTYVESHYPDYPRLENCNILELLVADSNQLDGIVTHFLNSTKASPKLKEHSAQVHLSDFFDRYPEDNIKEIWDEAHAGNRELCHGLRTFASAVYGFKGAFWVRSGSDFTNSDSKHCFYMNRDWSTFGSVYPQAAWIPGTQFAIAIDRKALQPNEAAVAKIASIFDLTHSIYTTTYRDMAYALQCREELIDILVDESILEEANREKESLEGQEWKDSMAGFWREWFNARQQSDDDDKVAPEDYAASYVYSFDLQGLCQKLQSNPREAEPFCKGFLASFFFQKNHTRRRYVLLRNITEPLGRVFYGNFSASFPYLDMEHTGVYFYPPDDGRMPFPAAASSLRELAETAGFIRHEEFDPFPKVFPYALFDKADDGNTLFEREMLRQASTAISSRNQQGFKLGDTHMRLGNKVHLDSFYEMAIFFENPNYAYYTAFLLLKIILQNWKLISKKHILFYGYASYSRGIVWAVIHILQEFFAIQGVMEPPEMQFAIYQNDLKLESSQPKTQMYYSQSEWQKKPNSIWPTGETALIQIVPISSSLTTFNKMLAELRRETEREDFTSAMNLTAFWVRDDYEKKFQKCPQDEYFNQLEERLQKETIFRMPTEEEKDFWEFVDREQKMIKSKLFNTPSYYLTMMISEWSNPLTCVKCFPKDPLGEYPLVETDPTSTVPTQQLYLEREQSSPFRENTKEENENDRRISRLRDNLFYGHVVRGRNHYQYYIRMREYFQQEREEIKEWLQKLPPPRSSETHVLVIPQHTSNVEFSQYIYEYYFRGEAECIIVNTEKEFRSNFESEYSGLFYRLKEENEKGRNVKFYYIDNSIRSGDTINRASSLIPSYFYRKDSCIFDEVFLLVNRSSMSSMRAYVKDPEKNLHAYAKLRISAMRTFGDSCIPCKMQQEATHYYENAATKSISAYWEKKSSHRDCVPFDKVLDYWVPEEQKRGYQRMICSHRAAHYLTCVRGGEVSDYFGAIREFFTEIQKASVSKEGVSPIYQYLEKDCLEEWFSAALKVIIRPFFSYDYKLRCAVMDLCLILSEIFIKDCGEDKLKQRLEGIGKDYILKNGNLEWIYQFQQNIAGCLKSGLASRMTFVRNNVLKGLADIKSNYILRRETIQAICSQLSNILVDQSETEGFVRDFFEHYIRSILRITNNSSDEYKSIWLEYLLQSGTEYPLQPVKGQGILTTIPNNIRTIFQKFWDRLLVENNRPLYQGVKDMQKEKDPEKTSGSYISQYHMHGVRQFLDFGGLDSSNQSKKILSLCTLLKLLETSPEGKVEAPLSYYEQLQITLQNIISLDEDKSDERVIIFAEQKKQGKYLKRPPFYVIAPRAEAHYTAEDDFLEKVVSVFKEVSKKDREILHHLDYDGFYLAQADVMEKKYHIIIKLDNNYREMSGDKNKTKPSKNFGQTHKQKIEAVYFYIPCGLDRQRALMLTRELLMFRCKLIAWLERDFNNDAIAVLFQQRRLAEILAADKVGDHSENDFIDCMQQLLTSTKGLKQAGPIEEASNELGQTNSEMYRKDTTGFMEDMSAEDGSLIDYAQEDYSLSIDSAEWHLLSAYVNSRIARMYRTLVREEEDTESLANKNMEDLYSQGFQQLWKYPTDQLDAMLFTALKPFYSRQPYISLLMNTICFTVDGVPDTRDNPNASIPERMENFRRLLNGYRCCQFKREDRAYAFASEYMAVIFLDCWLSGVKAGEVWNTSSWEGKAYYILKQLPPAEKCQIHISREPGGCGTFPFDYLVFKNAVFASQKKRGKGPGMSQSAMCWYIEKLWNFCISEKDNSPKVEAEKNGDEYIIRLPILRPKE